MSNGVDTTSSSIVEEIQNAQPGEVAIGHVNMPMGTYLFGGTSLATAHASLLVHQRESGIQQFVQRLSTRVLWISTLLATVILLSTGESTWLIVRRYDSRQEAVFHGPYPEFR